MSYLAIFFIGITIGLLLFLIIYKFISPKHEKITLNYNENDAEALLQNNGFKIIERQKSYPIIMFINGKSHLITETADFVVEKENKRYAVKVEAGVGVDPYEKTMRQKLVELKNIFPSYKILLLIMDRGELHLIDFEFPRTEKDMFFTIIAGLIIIVVIAATVFLLVQMKLF